MKLFWILLVVDALTLLLVLYFFFLGLMDGTVTSRNAWLWSIVLMATVSVLLGGYYFHRHGQQRAARLLLSLLAIPALLVLLFLLVMVVSKARWN